MSTYRMDGGTVVDTTKASQSWDENQRWDGRNHVSVATGSQWDHQRLYRSRKGRYYLEHWSDWQGSASGAEWVSDLEALRWLILNGYSDFPVELQGKIDEVTE
jgi:hypothetical protein